MAYDCEEQMGHETLLRYNHQNRRHNSFRIDSLEPRVEQMEDETAKLKDVINRLSARIDANERTQFESLLSQKRLEDTTKSLSSTVKRLSKRGVKCGYKDNWDSASSTITYDRMLMSTGTGRGSLSLRTGVWTASQTGLYMVTWSLINDLYSGEMNRIFLYRNDERQEESLHFSKYWDSDGYLLDQGSRTLFLELDDDDRLHLQTKAFSSDGATGITFCVHLLSAAA